MKMMLRCLVVLALPGVWSVAAAADDSAAIAGKASRLCAACHGEQGMGKNDVWPNLARQKQGYLIKQLRDFKTGARADPVMTPVAMELSEQDIGALAAYYSRIEAPLERATR